MGAFRWVATTFFTSASWYVPSRVREFRSPHFTRVIHTPAQFMANVYIYRDGNDGCAAALLARASRICHSCLPNCVWNWDDDGAYEVRSR